MERQGPELQDNDTTIQDVSWTTARTIFTTENSFFSPRAFQQPFFDNM